MIIIHPFAKKMPSGKRNPKDYPFWHELLALISEEVVQIGVEGEEQLVPDFRKNLSILELRQLISQCRTWIGIDSFFQHLAWDCQKPGIVLWSVSDPIIFGHPENRNLLKDRSFLAPNQFLWWDYTNHNSDSFIKPEEVIKFLQT